VLMCEPVHILGEISMQAKIGLQPIRAPVARDPGTVSILTARSVLAGRPSRGYWSGLNGS
jgi:hypothetical protein